MKVRLLRTHAHTHARDLGVGAGVVRRKGYGNHDAWETLGCGQKVCLFETLLTYSVGEERCCPSSRDMDGAWGEREVDMK